MTLASLRCMSVESSCLTCCAAPLPSCWALLWPDPCSAVWLAAFASLANLLLRCLHSDVTNLPRYLFHLKWQHAVTHNCIYTLHVYTQAGSGLFRTLGIACRATLRTALPTYLLVCQWNRFYHGSCHNTTSTMQTLKYGLHTFACLSVHEVLAKCHHPMK